jgi:hypothetical protein
MANRKVNHSKNIFPSNLTRGYIPGDFIQFNYRSDGGTDKRPTVFVINKDLKVIRGININYLKEYKVSLLLQEKNYKKLKHYSLYEDSFRTYSINKISRVKIIEFKTNKMLAEENKREVELKLKENEIRLKERELKKQSKIDESKL